MGEGGEGFWGAGGLSSLASTQIFGGPAYIISARLNISIKTNTYRFSRLCRNRQIFDRVWSLPLGSAYYCASSCASSVSRAAFNLKVGSARTFASVCA